MIRTSPAARGAGPGDRKGTGEDQAKGGTPGEKGGGDHPLVEPDVAGASSWGRRFGSIRYSVALR